MAPSVDVYKWGLGAFIPHYHMSQPTQSSVTNLPEFQTILGKLPGENQRRDLTVFIKGIEKLRSEHMESVMKVMRQCRPISDVLTMPEQFSGNAGPSAAGLASERLVPNAAQINRLNRQLADNKTEFKQKIQILKEKYTEAMRTAAPEEHARLKAEANQEVHALIQLHEDKVKSFVREVEGSSLQALRIIDQSLADLDREQRRMSAEYNAKLDPLLIIACRSVPPPILDEAITFLNTKAPLKFP